jgi:sec-independent protein translocase protein TatB
VFGIGPSELLVILVIALLVLGPKRLPELARSLGKAMGEFRRATADITTELDNARIMLEEESRAAARAGQGKQPPGSEQPAKEQPERAEAAAPVKPTDTDKSA